MCPPMPGWFLLARTTMAMAFQRTRLLMRRSISREPGKGGSRAGGGGWVEVGGDGVDVGGVGGEGDLDAAADGLVLELRQQVAGPCGALGLQDAGQRVEPFAGFGRVAIAVTALSAVGGHDRNSLRESG